MALLGLAACGGSSGGPDAGTGAQPLNAIPCADPRAGEVLFCLAGDEAGIGGQSNDFFGSGLAVFDADLDGDLDLFAGGDATTSLFLRGRGDGSFERATGEAGLDGLTGVHGVVAADYDNDGDRDLFLARQTADRLLRNDGGRFVDVTDAAGLGDSRWGSTAAFGDYDGDGLLDLYVGNWADYLGTSAPQESALYRNQGDGTFADVTAALGLGGAFFTQSVAMSDHDGDGDVDLLQGNDFGVLSGGNRLFRNDGAGDPWTLTEAGAATGMDLALFTMNITPSDYDRDGDLDYYLSNIGCNVLARQEAGRFTDVGRQVGAGVCDTEDPTIDYAFEPADPASADADERAIAAWQSSYVADADRPALTSWAAVFVDFDHDGWEDLFVVNGQIGNERRFYQDAWLQPNALLRAVDDGSGGRGFADVSAGSGLACAQNSRSATAADVDGDGDQDLLVSQINYDGPAVPGLLLYRNQAAAGHWLIVELVGAADGLAAGVGANRDGIGARVEVDTGDGPPQLRERSGGGGYLGEPAAQLHFGLGDATTVDVTVRWPRPSLAVDRCTAVAADRVLQIHEGDCP